MMFNKYQQTGHKGPRGIKDRLPIFYLLELIKEVKIGISRNALLHRIEILMKFSNMYTFFRFDKGNCVHVGYVSHLMRILLRYFEFFIYVYFFQD